MAGCRCCCAGSSEARPDVVCLQELKAPTRSSRTRPIDDGGLRRHLARPEELERRRHPRARRGADRDPPRPARRSRRHAQPLHRGGGRRHAHRLPLSAQRQSGAGPEVRLQAALVRAADRAMPRSCSRPERRSCSPATTTSCRPSSTSTSPSAGSTTRCSAPEVRDAYPPAASRRAGPTRCARSIPDERIYTFWDYFRNAYARNAGLRIDHLLLSPPLAGAPGRRPASTARCAAGKRRATTRRSGSSSTATGRKALRAGGPAARRLASADAREGRSRRLLRCFSVSERSGIGQFDRRAGVLALLLS